MKHSCNVQDISTLTSLLRDAPADYTRFLDERDLIEYIQLAICPDDLKSLNLGTSLPELNDEPSTIKLYTLMFQEKFTEALEMAR